MNVSAWGSGKGGAWTFLACVALNYPETNPTTEQRENVQVYLYNLMNVLPCRYCRDSSLEYIEQLPPEPFLNDRAGFCVFIYLFKSLVNKKLGKTNCKFVEFISAHEKYRAKCNAANGLGCTVPAAGKCPEEIADWCEKALEKYSNYQERIDDWKRQQTLKKVAKWLLYVFVIVVSIWLISPRVRLMTRRIRSER